MEYKYCENKNFEDLACGKVIYYKSGMTNFPVRLAQEIYGRCVSYLQKKHNICIYDPCCGGGYLLTVVGFLNMGSINKIIGSDINEQAVDLAWQNLSLLSEEGLEKRIRQLNSYYAQFGKQSHKEAIDSAIRLMNRIKEYDRKPTISVFKGDILTKETLAAQDFKADIVISDVPYGNLVSWQGDEQDPINILLENLMPILKPGSVVAICSDKRQKIKVENYKRLERQRIGKRKFEILTPLI
ncbi:MAG: hypothetical protein GX160_08360 [Clostridiales bacterium]|nr:hypothetical protein [Clostridiales bacterium]